MGLYAEEGIRDISGRWTGQMNNPLNTDLGPFERFALTGQIDSHTIGGCQDVTTGKLVPAGVTA